MGKTCVIVVKSRGVNPIKWRVTSRTYCHEIIFIRNSLCSGWCTCRDREWEETRGWLGYPISYWLVREERVGHILHQIIYCFARVLPFLRVYLSELYLFWACVLLVASANGTIDVAGRSFSTKLQTCCNTGWLHFANIDRNPPERTR